MSTARHHSEWLSLIEISGPFLSMPVLLKAFPQGLNAHDPEMFSRLKIAYEEWMENQTDSAKHRQWILFVLNEILEYKDGSLAEVSMGTPGYEIVFAEHGEKLRPDLSLSIPRGRINEGRPHLFIQIYPIEQNLEKPAIGRHWKASPATRMMELLHGTGINLGLISNGEHWMLVYAPQGEVTTFVSWSTNIWLEESITLRAFHSLLSISRQFGVSDTDTFDALLKESSKDQQDLTDQLGYQVRKAVEVFIQSLDHLDQDSGRKLLANVEEKSIYDGALTVMMRLVFLFSAEEREMLLLGDPLYDRHYAVSTLREQLRETADQQGEEILERRSDAWCRLLATFRAVYGGIENDRLRLPPYGGSLFDPDRYPFLEGRKNGTTWRKTAVEPLRVNNRTTLHLLEAMQILQIKVPGGGAAEARRLSFRALDIEQIGHIYEGLLDHAAFRAKEPILGLKGSKDHEPEISLSKLEELMPKGVVGLVSFLKEETGRSEKALTKDLTEELEFNEQALQIACGNDKELIKRVRCFGSLLREDTLGIPVVIRPGSIYVTSSTGRRSSGTHYTPRSLTEPIVQHTLEPLVYIGPAEGKPKGEWKLKNSKAILELKICDMAMGSGAFLVQVIRYLSELLVEAWEEEKQKLSATHYCIDKYGALVDEETGISLPQDDDEKLFLARRLVADRCIYGVDINPMAVEMAKLSLWLITLQKNRPFNFLDHALKCGDSLLGVSSIEQIEYFSLRKDPKQKTFVTLNLEKLIKEASSKRQALERLGSNDYGQINAKKHLYEEVETATAKIKALADCLIAFELGGFDGKEYEHQQVKVASRVELVIRRPLSEFQAYACEQLRGRRSFHWPVEFPEVFARDGFDAFVGNPPFMGGKKITGNYGDDYRSFLVRVIANGERGNADFVSYFLLRVTHQLRATGTLGLIATNTIAQGETSAVGLEQILRNGVRLYKAVSSAKWPGTASLEVSFIWATSSEWLARPILDGREVIGINSLLVEAEAGDKKPIALVANQGGAFQGSNLRGIGFVLQPDEAATLIRLDSKNSDVVFPYLIGEDLNSSPFQSPSRWVINFFDLERKRAEEYTAPFDIVESRVLPERKKIKHSGTRKKGTQYFWRYDSIGKELYETIKANHKVLVVTQTSKYHSFAFVSNGYVYGHKLVVFATEDWSLFAQLSSSFHAKWVFEYGGFLETRPVYSPKTCFQTFPFVSSSVRLNLLGEQYHESRRNVMVDRNEGLTDVYNRFHDQGEQSADISQLRAMQVEMDQTVAVAYGWSNFDLGHGFHETKQGVRYTISELARRIVLDRLLALNHQRHEEEVNEGLHEKMKKKFNGKEVQVSDQLDLFSRKATN